MALRNGRCTNFGLCAKADTRETQTVPEGSDFVCQECKRPLTPMGTGGTTRKVGPLVPILLGVVLLALIAYFLLHRRPAATDRNGPLVTGGTGDTILRLSGSNTVGAQLAPDLVEAWLNSKGASGLQRRSNKAEETTITANLNGRAVAVIVKAHGSTTAFTELAANSCDIGMASRKIKGGEAADLQSKGMGDFTSNAQERVLGLDGVAVIVNEASDKNAVSREELARIFSGEGAGQSWNLYARDDKSGTFDTFKDRVLDTRSLASNAKRFEDSRELARAVSQDRNGIGFVGLPYAVGVKTLAVSEKGTRPLIPNTMTIRTESYTLSRRLYFYLPQNPKDEAGDFVRFSLSPRGQDIVEKDGFIGQKVEAIQQKETTDSSVIGPAERLSVDFRFRTGSSQLDTKAVDDIKRVAAVMSNQYNGRKMILIGFADSTGNPASNLKLSKDRAQSVGSQFEQQGITPVFITGFGQQLPVADNGTPEGREKNRRVELWLRK